MLFRSSPTPSLRLKTSVKAGLLLSRYPEAPALFPERTNAESLWRIRFEPEVQVGRATILVAYEHRVRQSRASAGLGAAGVLPSQVPPPYRIRSLDAVVSESPGLSWRHELDRAAVTWRTGRANMTVGRQAVGWGRAETQFRELLQLPALTAEMRREWLRSGASAAQFRQMRTAPQDLADVVAEGADVGAFGATDAKVDAG